MGVEPLYSTISIHAPRGGSDNALRGLVRVLNNFNPRSPWGERPLASGILMMARLFQSTLPVGGATRKYHRQDRRGQISIHAPRGGSDDANRE